MSFESGYKLLPKIVCQESLERLVKEIETMTEDSARKRGGLRNCLESCPFLQEKTATMFDLNLTESFRLLRCIVFDKSPDANWSVSWHQDLNIKESGENLVPWNDLPKVVTLRLHLDPTPADNGALKIVPNSHHLGVLDDDQKATLSENAVTIEADPGDALLMSPLLLHSSSASRHPSHRRVVHVDYLLKRPFFAS